MRLSDISGANPEVHQDLKCTKGTRFVNYVLSVSSIRALVNIINV